MNYTFIIYLFIMIRSYYMSLYCRSLARTAVDVYTNECIETSFWRETRYIITIAMFGIDHILTNNRTHKYIYELQGKHKPL